MTLRLMDSKMLSKRCQAQAGDTAAAGKVAGSKGCRQDQDSGGWGQDWDSSEEDLRAGSGQRRLWQGQCSRAGWQWRLGKEAWWRVGERQSKGWGQEWGSVRAWRLLLIYCVACPMAQLSEEDYSVTWRVSLVIEAFFTLISWQEKFSPEKEPFSVHALSHAAKHCTWYCQDTCSFSSTFH